jgi:hypothetical protein
MILIFLVGATRITIVYRLCGFSHVNVNNGLGAQLGEPGQFGRACLATHRHTNETFAVKIISKVKFAKHDLEKFKHEVYHR